MSKPSQIFDPAVVPSTGYKPTVPAVKALARLLRAVAKTPAKPAWDAVGLGAAYQRLAEAWVKK